jgi:lipopolysaccharide export LptBFGC system permease protein LptF
MISKVSIAAGALVGAFAVFLIFSAVTGLWLLPRAEQRGRLLERAEMDAATTKAIGELTNEADRARVNRRLCLERGGVWLNGGSKCVERAAE